MENPEIAAQRARAYFKAKGYSDEWIETRMRGLDIRNELTGEWKQRGVKEGQEYAFLTAEISRGTFEINPGKHKEYKGLQKKHNLRDHMKTPLKKGQFHRKGAENAKFSLWESLNLCALRAFAVSFFSRLI